MPKFRVQGGCEQFYALDAIVEAEDAAEARIFANDLFFELAELVEEDFSGLTITQDN